MDDRAQDQPRTSWSSSGSSSMQNHTLSQPTIEDHEGNTSQPPSEGGTQYPTPPSSSSKTEYAPTILRRTTSTASGSAVTQLTPNNEISGPRSSGNRSKMSREAKNYKVKATQRPAAVSSSGPDPNSVPHEAFSSSPDSSYFKSPFMGRQVPTSAYTPTAVPPPINANFPQSPLSPIAFPGWGPNPATAGYPPTQDPFSHQQLGLPPIDHPYHSGFAYVNPKDTTLDAAFSNHPSLYDLPSPVNQEHMAGQNNENVDLPLETLTGYASLAARVSGQVEPRLKPVYRRFDWLHHRTLLSLQDQLGDLEQELIGLDSITTRRYGNMPVSGREERESNFDTHRQRNRLTDRIENLLRRYSKRMQYFTCRRLIFLENLAMSLEEMQKLPLPTSDNVQAYRNFLNHRQLLVESETEFLEAPDLITLSQRPAANTPGNNQAPPQPQPVQIDIPLRTLMGGFSMSFLCLAILLMVLPDLISRLVMVACYGVLIATVLSTTGHIRRLRQMFEG
ncbi:hypothetical protein FSARC_6025 [Fusarium sarcochroum]|uniref:DUF6594 domain-containing protein n=1 Tax=Fusarium sarcochroum TaxID=1208366 RepID=A0A8H4TYC8_9HYPO|nr:hypothetical protein FSARC_6025 [Fusarium sarcochroum]